MNKEDLVRSLRIQLKARGLDPDLPNNSAIIEKLAAQTEAYYNNAMDLIGGTWEIKVDWPKGDVK